MCTKQLKWLDKIPVNENGCILQLHLSKPAKQLLRVVQHYSANIFNDYSFIEQIFAA